MPDNPAVILVNALRSLSTHVCKGLPAFHHEYTVLVIEQFERRPGSILIIVGGLRTLFDPGIIKGQCILHFTADTPLIAFRIYRRAGNMHKRKECTAYTSGKKHHAIHESRSVHNATLGFSIRIGYIDVVNQPDTPLCVRYEYGHIDFSIVTDHQFVDFRLHRSFRNKLGITFACRQHRRRQD